MNALNTNILSNALSLISPLTGSLAAGGFNVTGLDELQFNDATADPTASTTPRIRNNAATLKVRVQDARTATVARPFGITADTSGTPAANIGIGMLFEAESADEAPSQFGAADFLATDVTAGSEDTVLAISLRTAGAALGERFRFASLGAFKYTISGTPTADRVITFPDADATIGASAGALSFAGSDTTERTTTSTSTVTLSTMTVTSIATTVGILLLIPWKKTSGAAAGVSLGVTLNATATIAVGGVGKANNNAESGTLFIYLPAYDTTYKQGFIMAEGDDGPGITNNLTSSGRPNAAITTVLITGNTSNALNTLGVKNVMVYAVAAS